MPAGGHNEAFSRVLIDKALEFSGWNLLDTHRVVFEQHTGSDRQEFKQAGIYALTGAARAPSARRSPIPECAGP